MEKYAGPTRPSSLYFAEKIYIMYFVITDFVLPTWETKKNVSLDSIKSTFIPTRKNVIAIDYRCLKNERNILAETFIYSTTLL